MTKALTADTRTVTRSRSSRSDDSLPLLAKAVDAQRHDVTRLQPDRRFHSEGDPGRGAGIDQIARLQHHELAQIVHDEMRIEDHFRRGAGLPALTVDVQPHAQV